MSSTSEVVTVSFSEMPIVPSFLAHLRELPEYYVRLAAMEADEGRPLVVSDVLTDPDLSQRATRVRA